MVACPLYTSQGRAGHSSKIAGKAGHSSRIAGNCWFELVIAGIAGHSNRIVGIAGHSNRIAGNSVGNRYSPRVRRHSLGLFRDVPAK